VVLRTHEAAGLGRKDFQVEPIGSHQDDLVHDVREDQVLQDGETLLQIDRLAFEKCDLLGEEHDLLLLAFPEGAARVGTPFAFEPHKYE
jgi:hypothetical protein